VADSAGLLSRCTGIPRTAGSNPALSATLAVRERAAGSDRTRANDANSAAQPLRLRKSAPPRAPCPCPRPSARTSLLPRASNVARDSVSDAQSTELPPRVSASMRLAALLLALVSLRRRHARSASRPSPAECEVRLDGERLGVTPPCARFRSSTTERAPRRRSTRRGYRTYSRLGRARRRRGTRQFSGFDLVSEVLLPLGWHDTFTLVHVKLGCSRAVPVLLEPDLPGRSSTAPKNCAAPAPKARRRPQPVALRTRTEGVVATVGGERSRRPSAASAPRSWGWACRAAVSRPCATSSRAGRAGARSPTSGRRSNLLGESLAAIAGLGRDDACSALHRRARLCATPTLVVANPAVAPSNRAPASPRAPRACA
jgi:hypothetical protein